MATESATPSQDARLWADSPPFLQSELLGRHGFRHAFFTRRGGISVGPFASLNFATTTGDRPEHVAENRRRAAGSLGVSPAQIFVLSQVHGIAHAVVDQSTPPEELAQSQGDIVVTRAPVAAAIRTADCVPVLLACTHTGLVAACHAGWKGCVAGAIVESVRVLNSLGATSLVAAIGPHISTYAFEVGEDVAGQLLAASPDQTIVERRSAKLYVNLRRMARAQLLAVGLRQEAIDDVLGCTVFDADHFFSFRRDGEVSGRMLSAIVGGRPSPELVSTR
jgi:polyphenol oxidase